MCYSIPGKVKEIKDNIVVVDYFGEKKKAINEINSLSVGDYIYAQGGFIIQKVPESEAKQTLEVWKEMFFQLQKEDLRLSRLNRDKHKSDKKIANLMDKALAGAHLHEEELLYLMKLEDKESLDMLFKTANYLRQKFHKNACCVHGIIEISNFCSNKCSYCGISANNKRLSRYRMNKEEVVNSAMQAVEKYGFQALVLQSGEDQGYSIEELSEIIREIKKRMSVLIFISFGEVGLRGLEKLYQAGARGLLLRFETSNSKLYENLHPGKTLDTRIQHIKRAYELGYLIITGGLIGLPGQDAKDIINDIKLAKELHAEMYSFGPFIPHPATPLAAHSPPGEIDILKTLAVARLLDPENAKILITTAFETLSKDAREKGLLSGASSIMLNATPLKYRKNYSIYPNKAYTDISIKNQIEETIQLLKSIGRAPIDLGVQNTGFRSHKAESPNGKSRIPHGANRDFRKVSINRKSNNSKILKNLNTWIKNRIKKDEINRYMEKGEDFINDEEIESKIKSNTEIDSKKVKDILDKSLDIKSLTLDETACLLNVEDADMLDEMEKTALKVKKKVYNNRIVTFAPLYLGNFCVNDCLYCGFRKSNREIKRRILSLKEVKEETKVLAGEAGHKRLIVVYGEHPLTDVDYIADTLEAIYSVKVKTRNGFGQIRRANVNAAPLSIEALRRLHEVGIGTYQVFQETYHHQTYGLVHPKGTIKGNYQWRLYCMHRAMEAGVDDVGLGALFGLYNWKFEVMGLVAHSRELEERFGVGAHTISFPRLESAENTPFNENSKYKVSDKDFRKLITVLRLAVPYTGMIITAREPAQIRKEALSLGVTQTDASTKIGIGAYSDRANEQEGRRQQFFLGDTRSLDEVIREYAAEGYITSFCTAGYRCGRTGKCIMSYLKNGKEGKFCKLNAVLTFREWLDDFASDETKQISEKLIQKEIGEIKQTMPEVFPAFKEYYERIKKGERDLYF